MSSAATVDAPFLTTTTYDVWTRDGAAADFRLFSNHIEHHEAEDMARRLRNSPASTSRREVRVARRSLVVEWLDA